VVEAPFVAAKQNIVCIFLAYSFPSLLGVSPPCFTSISLQQVDEATRDDAYREDVIQVSAATMYAAGTSDTLCSSPLEGLKPFQTVSALASCILALLDNLAVLHRAQRELDSGLKASCLPDFEDEPALP
jgi:hypothetical protein